MACVYIGEKLASTDLCGVFEMPLTPETRLSLIRRLQSGNDADAWTEFSDIYRLVIVKLASSRGLQSADAEDLAQKVLLSVSKHIVGWKPDPKRGRFRTWLQTIVRNATLNALSRIPQDAAPGGTTAMRSLSDLPQNEADVFDVEWKREALNWAAAQVRSEFEPATWDAFWLTAVEGQSPKSASAKTGKSLGAVYIARTRIMKRIRTKVDELLATGEES
jgi:RNA polymerase sigma-70 factor, ECF subfamily